MAVPVYHRRRVVKYALSVFALLTLGAPFLAAGSGKSSFTGVITDDMCAKGDHSQMRMGATDQECTRACVSIHGAEYVLYDGKQTYSLSDQKSPEAFAGQRVTITGTLNSKTKTIQVESIIGAK